MEIKLRNVVRFRVIVAAMLLLGTLFLNVAQAGPLLQDPRGDGGGGGGGGGGAGAAGEDKAGRGGPAQLRCASLVGQVINWGFGGEGGITTELKTGSWQISTISASDGNYGFGGLGIGMAVLHVTLAPAQAEQLQPLIQDAGVYLNCDFPITANVALFSGPRIEPPATIQMSAPDSITPGSQVPVRLTVKNGLPNEITDVIVTDLMPRGLVAVDVSAASTNRQNAKIIDGGADGQLVAVYLDKLAAGAEANIIITVTTAVDAPRNARITNTATLFYRESAADQTTMEITIGAGGAPAPTLAADTTVELQPAAVATATPILPPTPIPATVASPAPTTESQTGEEFAPPGGLPTTGEEFVPRGLLPVTGEDTAQIPNTLPETSVGLVFPLSVLGLLGLALLVHFLRPPNRED